ncbi:MAG TPA: excinuclease ABC subunit UvrC [Candidatus Acidoferrales bacterium]|jgi:excinuclease ABC subunit C|nr:excinuclease ABC subunit UvrC [Candidatus Acidoferrales bacterium]
MQAVITARLDNLPSGPGVYLMKDAAGRIIYIGKAISLKNRVRSYFHATPAAPRTRALVERIDDLEWIVTNTEKEALILESNLVKLHKPRYNVRLTDDGSFPYIRVTNEPYPSINVTRVVRNDGSAYFGPYTSAQATRQSVKALRKAFPLRSCSRDLQRVLRPCLNYQLKLCAGPCAGKLNPEAYAKHAEGIKRFLEGRQDDILKELRRNMHTAAANMEFEHAATLRDRIAILESVREQQYVEPRRGDEDVIAIAVRGPQACAVILTVRNGRVTGQQSYALHGAEGAEMVELMTAFVKQHYFHLEGAYVPKHLLLEYPIEEAEAIEHLLTEIRGSRVSAIVPRVGPKTKLVALAHKNAESMLKKPTAADALYVLRDALRLRSYPYRIEAFDVSNLAGAEAIGSMAVFIDGAPQVNEYRSYKIRSAATADDYAMLKEIVGRRYRERKASADLIVVDGGKGQVHAVRDVLTILGLRIPLVGLAKREELVYTHGRSAPVEVPQMALNVLMRIRDEAHRAAIRRHRNFRSRKLLESMLDQIPGVGKRRKLELLKRFGSVKSLKKASVEAIQSVPAVDRTTARNVFNYFNEQSSVIRAP